MSAYRTTLIAWLRTVADPIDQRILDHAFDADSVADMEQGCCHTARQMESGECDYVDPDKNGIARLIGTRYAHVRGYRDEWRPGP